MQRVPRFVEALSFRDVDALHGEAHVMVDGAPRAGSSTVLSHWPMSTTPPTLARDLSTEIAFAYLRRPRRQRSADLVSCDHFDEDGLCSLFVLVDPKRALEHERAIVEVARVGDFGVVRDERAARSVLAIRALCDPTRTPLDLLRRIESGDPERRALCFEELLARFVDVLRTPERYEHLFGGELSSYLEDKRAIDAGAIEIEQDDDLGLAIVRDGRKAHTRRTPVGHEASISVSDWALHSATDKPRILVVESERVCYYDRYETWVRFVSRRLPLRRDLVPLAHQLSGRERNGARWRADSPGSLVASLSLAGQHETSLRTDEIIDAVRVHLATTGPGWDPFRSDRPLVVS